MSEYKPFTVINGGLSENDDFVGQDDTNICFIVAHPKVGLIGVFDKREDVESLQDRMPDILIQEAPKNPSFK